MAHRAGNAGVSLLELIVAVAVAAVLALGVAPALGHLLEREATRLAARRLAESMALARAEALRYRRRVVIANARQHWEEGWEVFVDTNNDGLRSDGEHLLRQVGAHDGVTMRGNAPVRSYVSYLPSGRAALLSNAFQSGSIFICSTARKPGAVRPHYKLVLSAGGRVRLESLPAAVPECAAPLS